MNTDLVNLPEAARVPLAGPLGAGPTQLDHRAEAILDAKSLREALADRPVA